MSTIRDIKHCKFEHHSLFSQFKNKQTNSMTRKLSFTALYLIYEALTPKIPKFFAAVRPEGTSTKSTPANSFRDTQKITSPVC